MTPVKAYSVATAADACGLSRDYIRKEAVAQRLPSRRAGTRIVILAADFETWLAGLPMTQDVAS